MSNRFKVGDRVRVLPTAVEGSMRGCIGNVFSVLKVSADMYDLPYQLSDGVKRDWFGENELESADVPPDPQPETPAQEKTHDYMLGYGIGYYHTRRSMAPSGQSADYRAGFRAGLDKQHAEMVIRSEAQLAATTDSAAVDEWLPTAS